MVDLRAKNDKIYSEGFPENWWVEITPDHVDGVLRRKNSHNFYDLKVSDICSRPSGMSFWEWIIQARKIAHALSADRML